MATEIHKETLPAMMKYAFNEGKIPERDKQFVKMILGGGSSSGVYKEELVLHKLGYELNENIRDYDGYVDGRPVEVKSESYSPISETNKTKQPCRGGIAFSAPVNPKQKANQFSKDNMLCVATSWTNSGKCIAIIEFDWKECKLHDKMKNYKAKSTTAFKGTASDFKDCKSLRVRYANPKYLKYLTTPMQEILKTSIMADIDALPKEEILAEVCKSDFEQLKEMYFECLISS